jgi:hypothetical protein
MANQIVNLIVTQTVAPSPSTLQKTGALISQGATTLAPNARQLITQPADLTAILSGALAISSITWTGSVATVTTAAPHGLPDADVIDITISGVTPSGYNGTFECTVTGASTFTYPLASNPGMETVPGVWTVADVAELVAQVTTFFAQGSQQGVYVLELGEGSPAVGVAALATYITNNPGFFYAYLVPREWDVVAQFLALLATFTSTTALTYFFVTTTPDTYAQYPATLKCVNAWIEAPEIPVTEFSAAAGLWVELNYAPSSTNKVTPYAFSYVFGVTPYPTPGNGPLFASLKAAGVNIIGTGAEGGITNTIIFWGTTMDVRPVNYWYGVDWIQITGDQAVANAVINGSNNPANPLYFNQDGINRIQKALASQMSAGVSFGIVLFNVIQTNLSPSALAVALENGTYDGFTVVNADPFLDYTTTNPSDYKIGKYTGLTVSATPLRGFEAITININVTDFVSQ